MQITVEQSMEAGHSSCSCVIGVLPKEPSVPGTSMQSQQNLTYKTEWPAHNSCSYRCLWLT